jgi:eukaryotic-like serine/threonine-protein kinase
VDDQRTAVAEKPAERETATDPGVRRAQLIPALIVAGCVVLGLLLLQAVTDDAGLSRDLAAVQARAQAVAAQRAQGQPPAQQNQQNQPANPAFPPMHSLDGPFALSALRDLQSTVDGGLTAGDLRQDVALDFANQIQNLRNIVATGQDPRPAAEGMRQKVADRVREGSLTADRGRHLDDGLDHLEQAVR